MYRFFEILPGALIWVAFFLMFFLSWLAPAYVAVFIILYDTFFLLRTIYLFILLNATYRVMRENLKINWLARLNALGAGLIKASLKNWREVHHLVVLPMYKEPHALVAETFERLAAMNYPREKFIVVLATEEAGGAEAEETGRKIMERFGGSFLKLLVTKHPTGLSGEIPGKGSNETWAVRQAKAEIIDVLKIPHENILISVFDVDSQIFPEYFGILTHTFLTCDKPERSSFQPIPLFTNNVFETPALARALAFSSTFWNMMQQSRPENLVTFSSHSMPFKALVEIGFWDTHIVSEDSRIFWQCYIHYRGDWRTEPLFYPISMDANVAPTFRKTMANIYRQQRRWAWGSENMAYIFTNFLRYKKIPRKFYWAFTTLESFFSWAVSSLIIFSLGWLPIFLGGDNFHYSVLSYNLPKITGIIMLFSNVGIMTSAIFSIILLPPKPVWFRARHYFIYLFEWALAPLIFIFFASLPAIDAQTRLMLGGKFRLGFWVTPKQRGNPETRKGVGEEPGLPREGNSPKGV